MVIDELIDVTNKRLSKIDELILMNANNTLKLIDLQIQSLNELEVQTEDEKVLSQLEQQVQQLKNNRIMFVLLNKYIVSNKLDDREKNILLNILKRV
ncbi:peptidase M23 [Peribacillus frigoritolerans]|uniref:peptidase M23 n=1 Tax=Peribacillus frigoritolerans TaxID=450367 RepID=UPI0022273F70|nr:peptidase M23 [Peribacillus frigoritolerans]UYY98721.1 peptidase M23 [Peribacillus frigoritolerans]